MIRYFAIFASITAMPWAAAFAVGISLKTGEFFEARVLEEKEAFLIVEFGRRRYRIPRAQIRSIDKKDRRRAVIHVFQLKDGRSIRGRIARTTEDEYVVETTTGFEIIPRSNIAKTEYLGEPTTAPPARFRLPVQASPTRLGGGLVFGQMRIGTSGLSSFGAMFFIEPTRLEIGGITLGYRTEIDYGFNANSSILLSNHFAYGYRTFGASSWKWYVHFGPGISLVQFNADDRQFAGVNAAIYFGLGLWNLSVGPFKFRAGIRINAILEKRTVAGVFGAEIAMVYTL